MGLDLERLAREAPRDELPALLGQLAVAEARCRLRLAEVVPQPTNGANEAPAIDADKGATIAGMSRRWLLQHTRGQGFRNDISRKVVRFDEAGLRRWLAGRKR